jgi:hypothetical protein
MDELQARHALVGRGSWSPGRTGPGDRQVTYPMGADPGGYVLWTGDRRFPITISRTGWAGFAASDLPGGTTQEKARAVEDVVADAGRYSFYGDRVIHHVALSLLPTWVGSDQVRWVELAGGRLILSASPLLLAGREQVPRLVWERVDPDGLGH